MSGSSQSASELGLTPRDMSIKTPDASPSIQKLAQANGRFYNSLLDTYLAKGAGENRQQQINQLMERLPIPVRRLYAKGIESFEAELQENHSLLEQYRGKEPAYLLSCVMKSEGRSQEQINEVLQKITPENIRYVEPAPGVAIVQVEHALMDDLHKAKLVPYGAHAILFGSTGREEPSFMVLPRLTLAKGLDEEGMSAADNSSVRHEFHHFLWNFLERVNFIRKPQEATPELSEAFRWFRNELAAYTIEGRSLTEIGPYEMTYTTNRDIQKIADNAREFAYICMEVAKSQGVDSQSFLYQIMTSRNFVELKNKLLELTPLNEHLTPENANTIYSIWQKGAKLDSIQEVMRVKNATMTRDVIKEAAQKKLADTLLSNNSLHLRELEYVAGNFQQFCSALNGEDFATSDLLVQALRGKLPFPDEIVKRILEMPKGVREWIPIISNSEDFIRSFISFWSMDNEEKRGVYAELINATPEMRATFDKIKDEMIASDEKAVRTEFGYAHANEERKQWIDNQIQMKKELMLSLLSN